MKTHAQTQAKTSADALATFDLLPPHFKQQRKLHQAWAGWTIAVTCSALVLIATVTGLGRRAYRLETANRELLAAAAPFRKLREETWRLQQETLRLSHACLLVESAQPNDDLLQSLAAVALASRRASDDILIETIDVRLPLESDVSAIEPGNPNIPAGELVITAMVAHHESADQGIAQHWVEQLNLSDRIANATTEKTKEKADDTHQSWRRMTIQATPQTTRTLP